MTNDELVTRIKAGIDTADNMLQLYEQTKRFIYKIANGFSSRAEIEDLEQEGYLALYDAIDGYDIDKGYKLLTYAEHWIRQRIQRYIHNHGCSVRIPVHEQEKLQQYKKLVNAFRSQTGRKPSEREICYYLGVSPDH